MKEFYVIEDYTDRSIWDSLILQEMLKLPSKPQGWGRPENTNPEGDWTLSYGMVPLATNEAFQGAGIPRPPAENMPAIYCIDSGRLTRRFKVSAAEAAEFIRESLAGVPG